VDLDRLAISPRQRSGWASLDLGFTLTRLWWRPLFLSWLIPAALVWGVLHLVLYAYPGVAIVLTWWLKPLYDRFPLYILSKRLFGEEVTVRQCLRQARAICTPDLVPWLLWRRFNPLRSFVMPVTLLEGLKGRERDQRLGVLQMRASGFAMWLTVICVHVEALMPLDVLVTWFLLLPAGADFDPLSLVVNGEAALTVGTNLASLAAMALVAPFYVSAGFALYINRRIELEGWDIEVSFRGIAGRAREGVGSAAACALLALFILVPGPGTSTAMADEPAVPEAQTVEVDADVAAGTIEEVLAGEDFHNVQSYVTWRWKNTGEEGIEGEVPEWFIVTVEWFEKYWPDWAWGDTSDVPGMLASLLRGAVIALILLLLVFLLLRYRSSLARWAGMLGEEEKARPPPEVLFGMQVTRESLPADVPGEVMTLWREGQRREGLALLYRATLSQLIHSFDFDFGRGLTEMECVDLVARSGDSELAGYMQHLTRGWMRMAYAHVEPEPGWVQDLCRRWEELFERE